MTRGVKQGFGATASPRRRGGSVGLLVLTLLLLAVTAFGREGVGLSYRGLPLPDGTEAHLMTVDLSQTQLRVLDARDFGASALTAHQFAVRSGATAVVNASFFDIDGSPMGLLVVDGETRQGLRPVDWGVFSIATDGARIVHTQEWSSPEGLTQAVQSGPRLVIDGQAARLKKQAARRTALCTLSDGKVELLVVHSSVLASTVAEFFVSRGCTAALNLDGGPSTQLYLSRGAVSIDLPGGSPVPVALGVFAPGDAELSPTRGCGCR